MVAAARHPAKFTDSLLETIAEAVKGRKRLLDPLAGTGKIARIREYGFTGRIYVNDLEPEWAWQAAGLVDAITVWDAANLPYRDSWFDAIATSPTYGNRMADHHDAKDGSRRNTYKHALGRDLHDGNTGAMQWGPEYREAHLGIWTEARRVLCDKGDFVLNVSNHIRNGKEVDVTGWHVATLQSLGFELVEHHRIPTPRNRFGANGALRVDHESVIVFTLHKPTSGEGERHADHNARTV